MPVDRTTLARQWAATIIAAGFTPSDAVQWTKNALAAIPPDADPQTWVVDGGTLAMTAVIDEAAVQDARADWYVNAPQEYKLLLDDLGAPEESQVGLGEAVFFNPRHEPAGSSKGGQFAKGSRATIGREGEVLPGGESQVGGAVADRAWIDSHLKIGGTPEEREHLADTIARAGVPQRHLEGISEITTEPPNGYKTTLGGMYVGPRQSAPDAYMRTFAAGVYKVKEHTIHIAPTSVLSEAVAIHEVGHHVMNQKRDEPSTRMQDLLDLRRRGLPDDLNAAGLRKYSLEDGHELYADSFVVALKGSRSQQAELKRWLGEEWDALFVEREVAGAD